MKKRLILAMTLCTFLAGSTLVAQRQRHNYRGPSGEEKGFGGMDGLRGMRPGPGMVIPPDNFLINVLELDEDQLAEAAELRESLRATVTPLMQEGRAIRQEVKAQLDSENPDPTTVGELVIAGHALEPQIREASQAAREAFKEILTEEQLEKLENARPGRRGMRSRGPRGG